jgi:hypothetical protein
MNIARKQIPAGTKVYTTLARCCQHQQRRPSGVQAVLDVTTGQSVGFAALPAKADGVEIIWVK